MRSAALLTAGFLFLNACAAWADMIEVKGKGAMNGKILSEDQEEVKFKDAAGDVHVFPKADVLYSDASFGPIESDAPVAQKVRSAALEFLRWVKNLPKEYERVTKRTTGKLVGKMSKPINRSAVNAKSDSLATAMDRASNAAVALSKKNLKINQELKKRNDDFIKETGEDSRKGRFTSLD